jgi:hypothetical protein
MFCRQLLINTRLQPGAKDARRKNRLNGFLARSLFTALKRVLMKWFPEQILKIQ